MARLSGALVDQSAAIGFSFNGKRFPAFHGDTLASALLASDQHLVARSFKYHRPRGILCSGSEEPNALMTLHSGAATEPNTRATTVEVFDGLVARSQNHLGPLKHDLLAVNDLFSPFLSAGFYYKTFMWPSPLWEKLYEPMIRNAAGLGKLSLQADSAKYDKGFLHCDVLIIGAGAAGLSAALSAGRSGARVIIADEDFLLGGRLNSEQDQVNGLQGSDWAASAVAELEAMDNVEILSRTAVYGAFDHGIYGALQRTADHVAPQSELPRQVLWRIYSKHAILAAGATERPIAFSNNDRPGIMLGGAVRSYANRFGVACGETVTVFTNNNDGWRTARDLQEKGVNVAALIDSRADVAAPYKLDGVAIHSGTYVCNTKGRQRLSEIELNNGARIKTDNLAVAGGWNPNVHLTCHQGGRPVWDEALTSFVPNAQTLPPGMRVAGAAMGCTGLGETLQSGHDTALEVLKDLGLEASGQAPSASDDTFAIEALWRVPSITSRAWVDFQNDVTEKDVTLAHEEGFVSVEHLKRYTTLGMATDQGKTANLNGLAIMAEVSGKSIEETGVTLFRPPYTPVPMGAFGGRARGHDFKPTRLTPSHKWALEQGAQFVETGNWLRAQWFPQPGESDWRQSVDREVRQTRNNVGICDVSTLGKIDIQGKDAAEFLNRLYINPFLKLAVGKVRYGLMLREDGFAKDDGTTARLSEHHFIMTTTTANAVTVFSHMEFCKQCLWPELDVHLISVTEQFAQYAVAGPKSRALLQDIADEDDILSDESIPYMGCKALSICGGIPAFLYRISFSGEMAYELAVAARYGDSLWRALIEAGQAYDVVPYGTEALGVMRIEKGHAAGNELNGQTTAQNLGLGRMMSKTKDFIGATLAKREAMNQEDGLRMMGFVAVDPSAKLRAGAHLTEIGAEATMENDLGWLSSMCYSPMLERYIALGFIKSGDQRVGERVMMVDLLTQTKLEVEVVSPHFYDPEGERLRG